MSLRQTANAIKLSLRSVRLVLYGITRTLGSRLMIIPIGLLAAAIATRFEGNEGFIYLAIILVAGCGVLYPYLKPKRALRLSPKPAPPPAPLPSARATMGRSDDPDEATVIGRLDPKLRDILQQKPR